MALDANKDYILQSEIAAAQLQGKSNPLTGNVSENQAMFDKLPKMVAGKVNSLQKEVAEKFDFQSTEHNKHKDDTNNPHKVTAEQVGSLKIYTGFHMLNKELGTSFDGATPVETVIQAMPDNTGLKADIAIDPSAYPTIYGVLTIYKIRENRVEVEFVSNAPTSDVNYNQKWIGQYNAGVFGGFVKVFTEHNKPTASDVGAYTKKEADEKLEVVKSVALGRATGYVFDTKADLDSWLENQANREKLVMGDNFYIRDVSVPDYWWDAESGTASELETQKVDLSEYAKHTDVEGKIESVDDALSEHKQDEENPHKVTASQVGAYTKTETNTLLDKKADKSDISNVYSFRGTVENIEDVLIKYQLIPSGNPTVDGEIVGTYDSDGIYFKQNTVIPEGSTVKVPVRPVTLKPGEYHIGSIFIEVNGASWPSGLTITETTTITEVCFTIFSGGHTFEEDQVFGIDIFFDSIYVGNKSYNGAAEIGDVYNETSTGMNYAWTGTEWDSLGGEHKDLEAREEIKRLKESAVSAYRFCGSVETFEDLPVQYQMIPNGVPTHNGQVCGTYDEKTHTVTIDDVTLVEVDSDRIIVPIVPINVKSGKYFCDSVNFSSSGGSGHAYIGTLCTYVCGAGGGTYETLTEGTIDHIEIFTPHGDDTISANTNNLGVLPTIIDSWIDEDGYVFGTPTGAYDAGAIYEVKESGLSYGWTGSTWDALGTSHIDSEARADIEQLELQVGDIETALDSIIEIQNGLIGGDSV